LNLLLLFACFALLLFARSLLLVCVVICVAATTPATAAIAQVISAFLVACSHLIKDLDPPTWLSKFSNRLISRPPATAATTTAATSVVATVATTTTAATTNSLN